MAKCTHCSAPLPKSGIICSYCGVRNDIDLTDKKKYVNLRPDLKRDCPICHIQLQTINVGKNLPLYVDRCESCFGIFFDLSELEEMLEYSVKGSKNVDLLKLAQITENPRYVDILTYRKCPVCQETMHRKNFMQRSGVITDMCYKHGIWLDSGELRHIMEWIKVGGIEKIKASKEEKILNFQSSQSPRSKRVSQRESSERKEENFFEMFFDYFFDLRY